MVGGRLTGHGLHPAPQWAWMAHVEPGLITLQTVSHPVLQAEAVQLDRRTHRPTPLLHFTLHRLSSHAGSHAATAQESPPIE